ncbi:hypothetical protein WHZ78_16620 [Bradyrhizobium symbiodeficiens]|uniref:hypothetical protein n=1 Tax=Bradyrhizobium symbiodeficiens TaxID=1404367 RepID=UPI0030CA93B5
MARSAKSLDYKVMSPALMSCSFERNDISQRAEGAATKRFVSGDVRVHAGDGAKYILATCEFSAGEELEKADDKQDETTTRQPFFEVKAEYILAVELFDWNPAEPELTKVFSALAAASAWPLFRSYFASVTTQALSDLPPLPIVPDFIDTSVDQD